MNYVRFILVTRAGRDGLTGGQWPVALDIAVFLAAVFLATVFLATVFPPRA